MKNFEKYLDDIAAAIKDSGNCVVPRGTACCTEDCAECFKRWAMQEATNDQ